MDTFNASDIKRLGYGDRLRVAGEYGGIVYRRTLEESRRKVHGRKQAEYIISCPHHTTTRDRYANTLKLAVSMAEDTSLWCQACSATWRANAEMHDE
jgi:hypothetical protein